MTYNTLHADQNYNNNHIKLQVATRFKKPPNVSGVTLNEPNWAEYLKFEFNLWKKLAI